MTSSHGFTLLGMNRMEMPTYDPLRDVHLKRHWKHTTKRDPKVRKLYKNRCITERKRKQLEKEEKQKKKEAMKQRREAQRAMMRAHRYHQQQTQQPSQQPPEQQPEDVEEDIQEDIQEQERDDIVEDVVDEEDIIQEDNHVGSSQKIPYIRAMSTIQVNSLKKPHKITPRKVQRNKSASALKTLSPRENVDTITKPRSRSLTGGNNKKKKKKKSQSPKGTLRSTLSKQDEVTLLSSRSKQSLRSRSPKSSRSKQSLRSRSPRSSRSKHEEPKLVSSRSKQSLRSRSPKSSRSKHEEPKLVSSRSKSLLHSPRTKQDEEASPPASPEESIEATISTTQPLQDRHVELFGCGANDAYQLQHRDIHLSSVIHPIAIDTPFAKSDIADIALGDNHSVYLTKQGEVYVIGSNEYGQCGMGSKQKTVPTLTKLALGTTFSKIAVGAFHTLLLSRFGKLFVCGRNHRSQCGIMDNPTLFDATPLKLNFMVANVVAGEDYSFVTTPTGEVYVCGDNNFSKGGRKTTSTNEGMTRLPSISDYAHKIKAIAPSSTHTLFLFENGAVMACGLNNHFQCGLPGEHMVTTPTLLDPKYFKKKRITHIQTTKTNSFFFAEDTCFVCGPLKPLGILPNITRKTQFTKPRQLKPKYIMENAVDTLTLTRISTSSHGGESLFYHLQEEGGQTITLGMGTNRYGQLALAQDNKMQVAIPERIHTISPTYTPLQEIDVNLINRAIHSIYCSNRHSIMLVLSDREHED